MCIQYPVSEAQIRQSAAVTFKNIVKNHWVEKEPDVVGAPPPYAVGADEKARSRRWIPALTQWPAPSIHTTKFTRLNSSLSKPLTTNS